MPEETKRIRDPIHGLITFDLTEQVDRTAWKLIDTPEFQRLRRIKQLGVSEFTFPGATHNRFTHSIGVFHLARKLMSVAERAMKTQGRAIRWNSNKAHIAVIAALVHDLGHGPFSHAFEEAEKTRLKGQEGVYQNHEAWTAEIISAQTGSIRRVLTEEFGGSGAAADDIAALLTSDPTDIYGAVVSSSFDADRLDYLQRDKLMTGSGAGGIDFDWLIDNLRVQSVSDGTEGIDTSDSAPPSFETFCFSEKALQAAEAFVIARYHLYSQVYYHKTTRGVEQLLSAFLQKLASELKCNTPQELNLSEKHPLVEYYASTIPTLQRYLTLDDTVIWSAAEACKARTDTELGQLANRLRNRDLMKPITIDTTHPTATDRARRRYIEEHLGVEIGKSVFLDRAPLNIYKDARREPVKPHKRVRILRSDESTTDLARLSKPIEALTEDQEILRYYFLNESTRQIVQNIRG
ncbi:MAG: hypothetical protein B7Y12_07120 [Rhizobiales bacterium 24-66-13]|nr:MAG: hypothetical protein B7Y12_07120 [Rhizobiales bacterium 24-66-13]OZB09075.1 MAG: hypothetical protein B7X67_07340 [Rhizobiales bacterium 39-66-18]HQS10090.1 HD domain-containing protein [Xanthobacteraceae bacterium]HQS46078.1 HD domain-containing protein [Xanthobacteraceae bacterium]